MAIKKYFYITVATVGGGLLAFLVQTLIELWFIPKLIANYDSFSFGLSWSTWFRIHNISTVVALLVGLLGGNYCGKRWWQYVYVDHCRDNKNRTTL